ncbi:MAG: hypothetical protein JNL70_21040 [Saprospiraceae bacterium]|nr:hypothetical protein [Saprospiraceae bacterium]
MKSLHFLFFTILFSFFTQIVSGQTNKPCNNFDCAYKKAENFLKQAAYQKALDNLDSAEGYLTDTNTKEKEQIKQLRRQLFVAIEKEKEEAKRARDEAEKQKRIVEQKTKELELALAKNEKIIKALYFYKDKYALVYQYSGEYSKDFSRDFDVHYGFYFIDKDGNEVFKDKMFDIAFPFDDDIDLAKVKVNETDSIYSFLDTLGSLYPLATKIESLHSNITAIDLTNQKLDKFPEVLYKNTQLKIIILRYNQLTMIDNELKNLSNLSVLNLKGNSISEIEQNRIKKLLPNCKIEF